MNIAHNIEDIPHDRNSVITVGTFDGVHLAHKKIISTVIARASEIKSRSIVFSFEPHPREILSNKKSNIKLLTTLDERAELFANLGIDWFFVINFDKEFSQLSYIDFIKRYLVEGIGLAAIIEGYDHHFGKLREGNINNLMQLGHDFGFEVIKVEPYLINGKIVNSSLIREYLETGDVSTASELLGRPYLLSGNVTVGDSRGRLLGYPTANIDIGNSNKLIPKNGIYFVRVKIDEDKYFGMTSIGERPTFHTNEKKTIEVHILNFNKDIYNKNIKIEFLRRLRNEEKFESAEKLIEQMNIDREISVKLSKEY